MLKQILTTITLAAALCMGTTGAAQAMISEPDVVYYGTAAAATSGSRITIALDGAATPLASCTVGSNLKYVLRVPMDAVGSRVSGTARSGDAANISINGTLIAKTVIPSRGKLVSMDLERNAAQWAKDHPGDDGSGDANHNGVTDLQEYLNGTDPYSPNITGISLVMSTLADGAFTNTTTLNVSGTVSDSDGIKSLTINNQPVTVAGDGKFSSAISLVNGSNRIETIATDNANNISSDIRRITLDRTVPGLAIDLPADNVITSKAFVETTGSIDDTTAIVTAKVNKGSTTTATMNGTNFSVTLNLNAGINTIDVTVTDQAGNSNSAKRTITSDTAAPTLAVTVPAQDISTTQSSITIFGTVVDSVTSATISMTVDDQAYTPAVAKDGSFSQDITMAADKTYAVIVTATDQADNKATVQRNIIKSAVSSASGDINGDGVVDIADALKVLRIAVGLDTPTAEDYVKADVAPLKDGKPAPDGVIDIADVVVILQKAIGARSW